MLNVSPEAKLPKLALTFGAVSVSIAPKAVVSIRLPPTKVVLTGATSIMLTLLASPEPMLSTVTV